MLINSLSLKNFKCFEEVSIDFAPITLLTGANSSGKSSLINALLAIFQTRPFPQYLSLNGDLVSMGGFDEVLWKNSKSELIDIEIKMSAEKKEISTQWAKNKTNQLPQLEQFNGNEIKDGDIFKQDFFPHFNYYHQFNYIGSYRNPPERTYYRKPKAPKIKPDGEGYIDQIIEWEEIDKEKFEKLFQALKEIELFAEIKSTKISGGRFELNVKTQKNSHWASLTDVGFGVSQFLPIIVADLQLNDNSLLAISQPEIHLHPKIQAKLGDYFCKQIKNSPKQYIVETHSEYLLNRIRLLLVKGELKPEEVNIYYMENDGDKTITHKIEFLTDGQIRNAPESFFDTYGIDVMEIALNSFPE
jgi:predicted ATPase